MADLEKIAEEISGLSLLEAADLVSMLEEKLGVSAAAPMAMAAMPMAGAAAERTGRRRAQYRAGSRRQGCGRGRQVQAGGRRRSRRGQVIGIWHQPDSKPSSRLV